ncbi:MAG: DUF167 domain-containing protein [Planctomycetes bacterium]|nr:DUF167 domain-containing protein [Planctomycetota bacterium]
MPVVEATNDGVKIFIKVVPNASRDELSGVIGDRLKVRVKSPPESGKANTAVVLLLAKFLDVKKNTLAISQGTSSAHKTIIVRGISIQEVLCKMNL